MPVRLSMRTSRGIDCDIAPGDTPHASARSTAPIGLETTISARFPGISRSLLTTVGSKSYANTLLSASAPYGVPAAVLSSPPLAPRADAMSMMPLGTARASALSDLPCSGNAHPITR